MQSLLSLKVIIPLELISFGLLGLIRLINKHFILVAPCLLGGIGIQVLLVGNFILALIGHFAPL